MDQRLLKAFKNIRTVEPSKELEMAILSRLTIERNRKFKRNMLFSRLGIIGSLAALAYSILTYGNAFLSSDFWNMLSLAFSDAMIIASHWNEFIQSLLETFPAITVTIILTPLFTLLLSISFYIDSYNKRKFI